MSSAAHLFHLSASTTPVTPEASNSTGGGGTTNAVSSSKRPSLFSSSGHMRKSVSTPSLKSLSPLSDSQTASPASATSQTAHLLLPTIVSHPLIKKLHLKRKKVALVLKQYLEWREQVLKWDLLDSSSVAPHSSQKQSPSSVGGATWNHDSTNTLDQGVKPSQTVPLHHHYASPQSLTNTYKSIIYSLYHYLHGTLSEMKPFCKRKAAGVTRHVTTIKDKSGTPATEKSHHTSSPAGQASTTQVQSHHHRSRSLHSSSPKDASKSSVHTPRTNVSSPTKQSPVLHSTKTTTTHVSASSKRQLYILCLWNILLIDLNWTGDNYFERRDEFVYLYNSMVSLNGNGSTSSGTRSQRYCSNFDALLSATCTLEDESEGNEPQPDNLQKGTSTKSSRKRSIRRSLAATTRLKLPKAKKFSRKKSNSSPMANSTTESSNANAANVEASTSCITVSGMPTIDFDKKSLSIPLIAFLLHSLILDNPTTPPSQDNMTDSPSFLLLQSILQQDLCLYGTAHNLSDLTHHTDMSAAGTSPGSSQISAKHERLNHLEIQYNLLLMCQTLRRMSEAMHLSASESLVWEKIRKHRAGTVPLIFVEYFEQIMYCPPRRCTFTWIYQSAQKNSNLYDDTTNEIPPPHLLPLKKIIAPLCNPNQLREKYLTLDTPLAQNSAMDLSSFGGGGTPLSPGWSSRNSTTRKTPFDSPRSPSLLSSKTRPISSSYSDQGIPFPSSPIAPNHLKSLLTAPSFSSMNDNSILSFGEDESYDSSEGGGFLSMEEEDSIDGNQRTNSVPRERSTNARQIHFQNEDWMHPLDSIGPTQHSESIKIKLALYPIRKFTSLSASRLALKSLPPLRHATGSTNPSSFGMYYSSLIVGKWNLLWDPHTEVIVPAYPFSGSTSRDGIYAGVGAPVLAVDIAEIDKSQLGQLLEIISSLVVKWNTEYRYGTKSSISRQKKKEKKLEKKLAKKNGNTIPRSISMTSVSSTPDSALSTPSITYSPPKETMTDPLSDSPPSVYSVGPTLHSSAKMGNCQNFVEDVLNHFNISLKDSSSLSSASEVDTPLLEYFRNLNKTGKASHTFTLTESFKKHFKIQDLQTWASSWNLHVVNANTLKFKTHRQLDLFMHFLRESDPHVETNFAPSWHLLKAFDRAYWIEHVRLHVEKEAALSHLSDQQQREKLEKALHRTEPAYDEEDVLLCAFGNPLESSFCVTPNSSASEDDNTEERFGEGFFSMEQEKMKSEEESRGNDTMVSTIGTVRAKSVEKLLVDSLKK